MDEAGIETTDHGVQPAGPGWWILNVRDIAWETVERGGTWCVLEAPSAPSTTLGVGVHVLPPGESSGMYHRESEQEGFLVLAGECLLLVEGEERRLKQWDYFHCPPDTSHMTIGAEGDEPCAIFMVGTRGPDQSVHYPADPLAAAHGVAAKQATDSPREAYAERPPIGPARSAFPPD